jgi:hypothetical protein
VSAKWRQDVTGSQPPGGTVEADAALPCARSGVSLEQTNLRPNNTEHHRQATHLAVSMLQNLNVRRLLACMVGVALGLGARCRCSDIMSPALASRAKERHENEDGMAWYRAAWARAGLAPSCCRSPLRHQASTTAVQMDKDGRIPDAMSCQPGASKHLRTWASDHAYLRNEEWEYGNYGGGGGTNRVTCPICCLVRSSSGPAAPRACAGGSLESCSAATTAPKPEPVSETRPLFAPPIAT